MEFPSICMDERSKYKKKKIILVHVILRRYANPGYEERERKRDYRKGSIKEERRQDSRWLFVLVHTGIRLSIQIQSRGISSSLLSIRNRFAWAWIICLDPFDPTRRVIPRVLDPRSCSDCSQLINGVFVNSRKLYPLHPSLFSPYSLNVASIFFLFNSHPW